MSTDAVVPVGGAAAAAPPDVSEAASTALPRVSFPRGRMVRLAQRGEGFVRISEAPPGAPTLLLLHGWTATADINWASSYEALAPHYGLIAPDLHGHGRGLRRRRRFRLKECADDVAALAEHLGVEKVIAVGYSMGGTVVQMLLRHHPDLVEGAVLCATAGMFRESAREFLRFAGLGGVALMAAVLPRRTVRWGGEKFLEGKSRGEMSEWVLGEMYRHEPLRLLQAGREIGLFDTRRWLSSIKVPAACVVTTKDEVVAPERQYELARLIGAQTVIETDHGHTACLSFAGEWANTLLAAVNAVAQPN